MESNPKIASTQDLLFLFCTSVSELAQELTYQQSFAKQMNSIPGDVDAAKTRREGFFAFMQSNLMRALSPLGKTQKLNPDGIAGPPTLRELNRIKASLQIIANFSFEDQVYANYAIWLKPLVTEVKNMATNLLETLSGIKDAVTLTGAADELNGKLTLYTNALGDGGAIFKKITPIKTEIAGAKSENKQALVNYADLFEKLACG